jgi:hypothetical protein
MANWAKRVLVVQLSAIPMTPQDEISQPVDHPLGHTRALQLNLEN